MLILSACRDIAATLPPPTPSPTPRSTALPAVPTAPPAGSTDNPIRIGFVVADAEAVEEASAALAIALSDASALTVEFVAYPRPADAVAALCASPAGTPTAVWLDGLSALAAEARACGDLALVAEREGDEGRSATEVIQLIVPEDSEPEALTELADGTFCRISATDMQTWLLPSLLLQANDVTPADIDRFENLDDMDALMSAVADGDCDSAGVPASALAAAEGDVRENIALLDETLEVAYNALLYPQQVPLGARETLNTAFEALAADDEQTDNLSAVLGADGIRSAERTDFASLRAVLARAGIDLARMGG
ncbi:MAG: PhnD/SsuA/transferrin family substrate-binding protein [Chloroflexota bacterium]|nr:PhnD/SsuA/transferrin family substrate-binding protein [Chloroflexota bacterium]